MNINKLIIIIFFIFFSGQLFAFNENKIDTLIETSPLRIANDTCRLYFYTIKNENTHFIIKLFRQNRKIWSIKLTKSKLLNSFLNYKKSCTDADYLKFGKTDIISPTDLKNIKYDNLIFSSIKYDFIRSSSIYYIVNCYDKISKTKYAFNLRIYYLEEEEVKKMKRQFIGIGGFKKGEI